MKSTLGALVGSVFESIVFIESKNSSAATYVNPAQ